uniref:Hypothetical secreted protein 1427 n=1 Tax=Amblyomma variegatum TaxID=34610 RepID=F0J9V6_AMBVA|nr:TPA_inf: hypothetical secreted protein 1427 [Amblyomma variegatum]
MFVFSSCTVWAFLSNAAPALLGQIRWGPALPSPAGWLLLQAQPLAQPPPRPLRARRGRGPRLGRPLEHTNACSLPVRGRKYGILRTLGHGNIF